VRTIPKTASEAKNLLYESALTNLALQSFLQLQQFITTSLRTIIMAPLLDQKTSSYLPKHLLRLQSLRSSPRRRRRINILASIVRSRELLYPTRQRFDLFISIIKNLTNIFIDVVDH
jgi:hypothetical protein